jgi:hypothetical protein
MDASASSIYVNHVCLLPLLLLLVYIYYNFYLVSLQIWYFLLFFRQQIYIYMTVLLTPVHCTPMDVPVSSIYVNLACGMPLLLS